MRRRWLIYWICLLYDGCSVGDVLGLNVEECIVWQFFAVRIKNTVTISSHCKLRWGAKPEVLNFDVYVKFVTDVTKNM